MSILFSSFFSFIAVYYCARVAVRVLYAYFPLIRSLKGSIRTDRVMARSIATLAGASALLVVYGLLTSLFMAGGLRLGTILGSAVGLLSACIHVLRGGEKNTSFFYETYKNDIDPDVFRAYILRIAAQKAQAGEALPDDPPAPQPPAAAPPAQAPGPLPPPAVGTPGRYTSLSKDQLIVLVQERDRDARRMHGAVNKAARVEATLDALLEEEPDLAPVIGDALRRRQADAPALPLIFCAACSGVLQDKPATYRKRAGGKDIAVLMAPARVCRSCGKAFFEPAVQQRLDALVQAGKAGDAPRVFLDWPGA